jgi:hypothetical protein
MNGNRPQAGAAFPPLVPEYLRRIVRLIVTKDTLVPLAQEEHSATLSGYIIVPMAESRRLRGNRT